MMMMVKFRDSGYLRLRICSDSESVRVTSRLQVHDLNSSSSESVPSRRAYRHRDDRHGLASGSYRNLNGLGRTYDIMMIRVADSESIDDSTVQAFMITGTASAYRDRD